MDDGIGTLRRRPGGPGAAPIERDTARRRVQAHHRRRRALALAVLAAVALIIGAATGAGGGSGTVGGHAATSAAPGYFTRLQVMAGTGVGSFVGVEKAAENAAINRTVAYTPYVRVAGAQHRELALTFDDGPGPYTPQFVAALQRAQTPATFFEVGITEPDFHVGTTDVAAAGFPIGDHTQNHSAMSHLSAADQQAQLTQQIAAARQYGASYPRLFRPPYGLWNQTTVSVLKKYGMLMVLWTVDTEDYRLPGVDAIVHSVVSGARPGAIVLMHDAGGNRSQTLAALPIIIKQLRARGYKLVTVPKLLLDNPAPANQQIGALTGSGG